jgi:NTP pyrophosphatase (non-canonical NTP hydrolase)
MNELIQNIKAWGVARNITGPNGKGTLLGQLSKTAEELTETRDAAVWIDAMRRAIGQVTDSEINAIKDGIGDTAVTLILAAEMAGLDFEACLQAAYDEIKGRTGRMENGVFVKDTP